MSDLSILTTDAFAMKYILVIEMFACAGRDADADRRYVVDSYFEDGSVLNLGIFKDLEKACREACRSASGACQVRVIMRAEERA